MAEAVIDHRYRDFLGDGFAVLFSGGSVAAEKSVTDIRGRRL
jgi:hypothetical protein